MNHETLRAGFLGAGGIARAHAFSLYSLRYYYPGAPEVVSEAVCASTRESSDRFAASYGFRKSLNIVEFRKDEAINAVYILGPNNTHFDHFKLALQMPGVRRIYLEKPVCSSLEEEQEMKRLAAESSVQVQVGFQYLLTASMREALNFWRTGKLGKPVHFEVKYYHGDYLQQGYRDKRKSRLTPAPDGGAMADLGSHAISMLVAFLGNNLRITHAIQAGNFDDVPCDSDLYSNISLFEPATGAAGTLAASRVSSGTGDTLSIEIYAEKGMLRHSSASVDYFEYYLEETGQWTRQVTGSNYQPVTSFPSGHVPPGWLRSMIHAHYIFAGGNDPLAVVPGLAHGLEVQRLVRETAGHLETFRKLTGKQDS